MYDEYGDGIDPIDYDELEAECNDTSHQANNVLGRNEIFIGVHPNGKYDFELWVDGGEFGSTPNYFGSFDEVREAIKEKYPNADWTDVGW